MTFDTILQEWNQGGERHSSEKFSLVFGNRCFIIASACEGSTSRPFFLMSLLFMGPMRREVFKTSGFFFFWDHTKVIE